MLNEEEKKHFYNKILDPAKPGSNNPKFSLAEQWWL